MDEGKGVPLTIPYLVMKVSILEEQLLNEQRLTTLLSATVEGTNTVLEGIVNNTFESLMKMAMNAASREGIKVKVDITYPKEKG